MGWIDQMISIIGTSKIDQLSSVIVGVNTATDSTCWACVRSKIPSSLTKLPSTVNALYPKPMPFGGMDKPASTRTAAAPLSVAGLVRTSTDVASSGLAPPGSPRPRAFARDDAS
jgi:hypothetical protein